MQGQIPTHEDTTLEEGILRARLYVGFYTRVAKQLGVSDSVVRRVANGLGKSQRIIRALQAEVRRIEREIQETVHKTGSPKKSGARTRKASRR